MSDGVIIEKPDKSTQKIEGNITIWTAGVKGNPVIGNSCITNTKDRVEVNEFLQIPNYPEVFVLGDCAIANSRDVKHAPTAQLASQMGEYCGESLIQILKGEKLIKPFILQSSGTRFASSAANSTPVKPLPQTIKLKLRGFGLKI